MSWCLELYQGCDTKEENEYGLQLTSLTQEEIF